MSIVQTQTTSFKTELYQGIHNLLSDTLYMALYTGNASLNAQTTVYAATNEISGTGYTAGGIQVTGDYCEFFQIISVKYLKFALNSTFN